MKSIVIFSAVLVLFIPAEAFSLTRKVPAMYSTIQQAIDASNNGDTVLVDPGTYFEQLNMNGKNIVLCSHYALTGEENYISTTILDGSNTGSTITINHGENLACQIIGFTIQHGNGTGNINYGSGGGILCYNASPLIDHCIIKNNQANAGSGIYMGASNGVVSYCTIENNVAASNAAGLFFQADVEQALAHHCIIRNNSITGIQGFNNGGAGCEIYHSGKLDNCLIVNNTAPYTVGGGLYIDWGTYTGTNKIFINNSTIAYNSAKSSGGINYICHGGIITNTIIYNNFDEYGNVSNFGCANLCWGDISFSFCCTYPLPAGIGNISANLCFIDPVSGNFRLSGSSPCINSGNNTYSFQSTDLDGKPRIINNTIDMGCYELGDAFKLVAVNPPYHALDIPGDGNIQLTFNLPVNPSSLSNIKLFGKESGLHGFSFQLNPAQNVVTIIPDKKFRNGERVEVVVPVTVTAGTGITLNKSTVWHFHVRVPVSYKKIMKKVQTITSTYAFGLSACDFNNDTLLDFIRTAHSEATVKLYKNADAGYFAYQSTYSGNGLSWATYPAEAIDIENDGDLDIVAPSRFMNLVSIWKNGGAFQFTANGTLPTNAEPQFIGISDYNGDGFQDMSVFCNTWDGQYVHVYLNDHAGAFTLHSTINVTMGLRNCSGVISVDIDQDGDVDMIGNFSKNIFILRNTGLANFTFEIQNTVPSLPLTYGRDIAGDLNGDGKVDILSRDYDDHILRSYFNDGTGHFSLGSMICSNLGPVEPVTLKDMDGDGDLDLIVTSHAEQKVKYFLNNGSGSFSVDLTIGEDLSTYQTIASDIDGDGDIDLITGGANVFVYKAGSSITVVEEPADAIACQNHDVSFRFLVSSNTYPHQYQWYKNGIIIPVSSNPTAKDSLLVILNTQPSHEGLYHCRIINAVHDTVYSRQAQLSIISTPPSILTQPACAIKKEHTSHTFSLTCNGSLPLTYTWKKNGSVVQVSGLNSYEIPDVNSSDAGLYVCTVENSCGSVHSDTVSLSVISPMSDTLAICENEEVNLVAHAFSPVSLSFQWKKDHEIIPGEIDSIYTILLATPSHSGNYCCVIDDGCVIDSTNDLYLIVDNAFPVVFTDPEDAVLRLGKEATFTVAAQSLSSIAYQWHKDGNPIAGAESSELIIPSVEKDDAGNYSCRLTNQCGSTFSGSGRLVVIDTQMDTSEVCVNGSAVLTVSACGCEDDCTFQWLKNGILMPGESDSILSIGVVITGDEASYRCEVKYLAVKDTSSVIMLMVDEFVPEIISSLDNYLKRAERNVVFQSLATGDNLKYNWYKNNNAIPSETQSILNLDSVTPAHSGSYYCIVRNACGDDTTNTASLIVFDIDPIHPEKTLGDTMTFNIQTPGSKSSFTYQWKKETISLSVDSVLKICYITPSDTGDYYCIVTNPYGTDTTRISHLTFHDYIIWRGMTDEWESASNWSSQFPRDTINVYIPTDPVGGKMPKIASQGVAKTKKMTIAPDAVLTLIQNTDLQIFDTLENNGSIYCSGALKPQPGGMIQTNGKLYIQSGGSVMHGYNTPGGGGKVQGDVVYIRDIGVPCCINNFWSSPIKSGNTGSLSPWVWRFDPGNAHNDYEIIGTDTIISNNAWQDGWTPWENKLMEAGRGYTAILSGISSFTGEINDSTIHYPVQDFGFDGNDGWNLIGNPYPSSISIDDFLHNPINQSIMEVGAVYLWTDDHSSGIGYTNGAADFTTFNLIGVIYPTGGGDQILNPSRIISSCQGFQIKAKINGDIEFTNSMRRAVNDVFYKQLDNEISSIKLGVSDYGKNYNEVIIAFKDDATDGFDKCYDAYKLKGNADLCLYSKMESRHYCINTFKTLQSYKQVPLCLDVSSQGSFEFIVQYIENFSLATTIILEDKITSSFIDLKVNENYAFQIDGPGRFCDRFVLHFNPSLGQEELISENKMLIYSSGKSVIIDNFLAEEAICHIFNSLGQLNYMAEIREGVNTINTDLKTGIYIVKVQSSQKNYIKKIFIQ